MIQAIVLDIEGTTCPVDFVSKTLFPFAQKHLNTALMRREDDSEIEALVQEAINEWKRDSDPISKTMLMQSQQTTPSSREVGDYLQYLIRADRKSTALKELQGIIWKQGYLSGEIRSPLFADVRPQLDHWKEKGIALAVYSSGSIQAQRLLYAHSNEGDITDRFCQWFDTRTGPKLAHQSYTIISQKLELQTNEVLFVSDHPGECDAARQAGMKTAFCLRKGNPHQDPGSHEVVQQLSDIDLNTIGPSDISQS